MCSKEFELLKSLQSYYEDTPQDVLDKDWKELSYLNEVGPDVFEALGIEDISLRNLYTENTVI